MVYVSVASGAVPDVVVYLLLVAHPLKGVQRNITDPEREKLCFCYNQLYPRFVGMSNLDVLRADAVFLRENSFF